MPFITGCPEWLEAAVYECKAHGVREDEPWDNSMEERCEDAWAALKPALEEHARGGCIEGAPFAFMVHSSGAQLMTLLAKRLREALSLEPAACFIVDRSPPNIRAISDIGYEMLKKDPLEFFEHFSPNVKTYYGKNNPVSDAMYERWHRGMLLTQGFFMEEKGHMFDCPIYVFIAMAIFENDKLAAKGSKGGATPDFMETHRKRCLVVQSVKDSEADWDLRQFGMWRRWTNLGKCEVQRIMTDHRTARFHPETLDTVLKELERIKDSK